MPVFRTLAILTALFLVSSGAVFAQDEARAPKRSQQVAVPKDWLEGVGDGFGVAAREADAYFATLAHARDVPLSKQAQLAAELQAKHMKEFKSKPANRRVRFSQFVDLFTHRNERRGEPVTLHGYIRRLEEMDAGENVYGLKKLYQCWMWTKDSDLTPYTIVVSELPPGMPALRGERDTLDRVTVTGYFFKTWTYAANTESGHWVSPLILAHRLEYVPPKNEPPLLSSAQLAGILIGAAAGIGLIAVLVVRQSRARREERRRAQQDAQVAEALRSNDFDLR